MGALRKLAEYDSSIAKDNAYEVTRLVFFSFSSFILHTAGIFVCYDDKWTATTEKKKK